MTFEKWYEKVNQIIESAIGLSVDDLADGPSWDSWHDGCTPREYARDLLEENGF